MLGNFLANVINPAVGGVMAPPLTGLVIHDSFTDAYTTPLTSHTIAPVNLPATSWINVGGANNVMPTIQSNAVFIPQCPPVTPTFSINGVNATLPEQTLTANIDITAHPTYNMSLGGLFVRATSAMSLNDFFWAGVIQQASTWEFRITETGTVRASQTLTIDPTSQSFILTVVVTSSDITMSWNLDATTLNYASTARNTNTYVGLGQGTNQVPFPGDAVFDEFTVTV